MAAIPGTLEVKKIKLIKLLYMYQSYSLHMSRMYIIAWNEKLPPILPGMKEHYAKSSLFPGNYSLRKISRKPSVIL